MPDGEERPIAFTSRTLSSAEKNYSQVEREALSIVYGVKRFHQYLYGRHFTLVTDHKPLTTLFSPKTGVPALAAAPLQRWALYLASHSYTIVFKSTHQHANADGLSRLPLHTNHKDKPDKLDMFYLSEFEKIPIDCAKIHKETKVDPVLSKVLEFTLHGWKDYHLIDSKDDLAPFYSRRNELTV